jgi:nicotinamidase-related amidase
MLLYAECGIKKESKEREGLDKKFVLDKEDAVLLIVDIQERLAVVMTERERVVRNNLHLIELARMINLPVVVTEQYPKGLGRTVPELHAALPPYQPIEKTTFDCCGQPAFLAEIGKLNRKKVILTGMETHICVLQTAIGLLRGGFTPHLVRDAVCSRTEENWKAGLEYMRDAGAVVTCTETVLFQLLKAAGTEEFKKISQRIK